MRPRPAAAGRRLPPENTGSLAAVAARKKGKPRASLFCCQPGSRNEPWLFEGTRRGGAGEVDGGACFIGNLQELGPEARGDRLGLRQGNTQGILVDARYLELVMQVRTGRVARHADISNRV